MLLDPIPLPEDSLLLNDDIDKIEALADDATVGRWCSWSSHDGNGDVVYALLDSVVGEGTIVSEGKWADVEYIAAVEPRVMKRLIRRLREAEGNFGQFIERARREVAFWHEHCRTLEKRVQNDYCEYFASSRDIYDMMFEQSDKSSKIEKENKILKAQGAELPEDDATLKLIAEIFERRGAWNRLKQHIETLGLTDNQACARAECDRKELASWKAGESLPSSAQARIISDRCKLEELMDAVGEKGTDDDDEE
jgi:hypothetical protein